MSIKKRKKTASKTTFWFNLWLLLFALSMLLLVMSFFLGKWGKPLACANSISCIKDLSGKYEVGKKSTFLGQTIVSPKFLAEENVGSKVLGATAGDKHIFVDLATQTLRAYEGDKLIMTFPVSTGKWGKTPTGDFRIWIKLRYAHMEGGAGADYYNLYNVPYTMFFSNDQVPSSMGFSLHGAYWHNNFGHTMSHGCVNIRPEDSGRLYDWAQPTTKGSTTYSTPDDPGTLVTIYGQPKED